MISSHKYVSLEYVAPYNVWQVSGGELEAIGNTNMLCVVGDALIQVKQRTHIFKCVTSTQLQCCKQQRN